MYGKDTYKIYLGVPYIMLQTRNKILLYMYANQTIFIKWKFLGWGCQRASNQNFIQCIMRDSYFVQIGIVIIINDMNTNLTSLVVNNTNYKTEEVHVNSISAGDWYLRFSWKLYG